MSGDAKTCKEFAEILKKAGLGMEDVMAEALSSKIEAFERIDRMLGSAEARRNNAMREMIVTALRSALRLRQAIDDVQNAEFRDVETGETTGGSPP
jgi:hypothetical protein